MSIFCKTQIVSVQFLVGLLSLFLVFESRAQDLEPRFLSVLPTGGNFAIASYGYSSGNILVDNSLPVEDLNAHLNNIVLGYARSFKLFNRLTKFDIIVPYSFGSFDGVVSNIDSTTSRNGLADPLIRISMILVGAKALKPADYFKYEPKKFKLGLSLRIRAPLGQYDPTKFINLGANRWAFKTALAASYTIKKKLTFEGHLIGWFFTENKSFYNGNTIAQKPLVAAHLHISYVFKPGIWLAVSVGTSGQGETIVNDVEQDDLQRNSRYGAAFAYRISKNHALKIALTTGVSTRYGADFTTLLIAYQFMWFDKK
ncbi:MAG: transporter [Bacteroidales bacterium]|nr:transporter [Bacteroidales bacterium]